MPGASALVSPAITRRVRSTLARRACAGVALGAAALAALALAAPAGAQDAAQLPGVATGTTEPSPATASESAPAAGSSLVFRDPRPLELGWTAAQRGSSSGLCNVGDTTARGLRASATGFGFLSGGQPVAGEGGVMKTVLRGASTLAPGRCTPVQVRVRGDVDPGVYRGMLTVISSGAGAAQRSVTITGPGELPRAAGAGADAATPATATLHARHAPFATGAALTGGGLLALQSPSPGDTLAVPRDCPAPGSATREALTAGQEAARCPFVGSVVSGGTSGALYVDGPLAETAGGPAMLPVRLEGAGEVGDYTGALDLAGTPNDPADDIPVAVEVSDGLGWAVIVLLAGLALVLALQLAVRRWRPQARLRARWRGFESAYAAAQRAFDGRAPRHAGFATPTRREIAEYAAGLDRALRALGTGTPWLDGSGAAQRELEASVALVEDDVRCWRGSTGLASSLGHLHDELQRLAAFLDDELPLPSAPRLAATAAALLAPRRMRVGEALELARAADSLAAALARWREQAAIARRYDAWLHALAARIDELDRGEQQRLRHAALTLADALDALLRVRDATELDRLDTARDLDRAYELLAGVGARHVWLPADGARPADMGGDLADLGFEPAGGTARMLAFEPADGELRFDVDAWIRDAPTGQGSPARPAVLARGAGASLAGSLLASVAAGVAGGLVVFAVIQPFGTALDYLLMVLAAAAVQALVAGIAGAAQGWRGRPEPALQPPTPATTFAPDPATVPVARPTRAEETVAEGPDGPAGDDGGEAAEADRPHDAPIAVPDPDEVTASRATPDGAHRPR